MQEAEEYSKNSLAKVVSAKATREAEETKEESSGRPPQVKWESCLRGFDDESQQLWLEIQTAPAATLGADAQIPDPAEIAALDNDNRHFAKIALGGREYTALIDPGATCSVVLPRVAEEIGAKVEKKAGWIQGGSGGLYKTWGDLPMTLSVDGLDGKIRAKLCDTVRHDVVLGMDFILDFDVDLRGGRHMWRAREGPWHPSKLPEAEDRPLLFAECAGISLCEPGEVERLNELVNRLLPEDDPTPGLTNRSEHHIRVMTNTPVRHHLRRMSPAMEAVAQAEVKKLYEAGFIERSASDWCSAPVIVRKQDGSNRFCIDYRDLNKVTLQDQYPIPNMDGILDKLRKAKYLSKVDLKNAYHQIPMEEHSKPYTAFAVPGSGLWQYTRMPFGLCNAPRTFQRLIDSLFGPEDQPHIFGYLDDIIVATDSFDEHLKWLEVVLTRLREAGLAVNRKKCEFCCQRLSYLGFLLDSEGLRPDPERVAPVLECKPPRTLKELRSFLGCISWYSRFIQMESSAKIPLLKLTKKDVPWKWGPEQQEAFDHLKQALVTAPVLARPDFTKPFKVQSDASAYAIGAVLTQEHEDGEHPIVYISRVLNKAEKNYSTTERECLAVVWAIKKFRPYLEGYTFTVVTDHSALKSLQTAREPAGRLARWALELQNWTFTIEHRKGTHMKVPDFLSRMPTQDDEVAAFENVKDQWYIDRLADVEKSPQKYREWRIDDGLLYRHRKDELLDPIENGVEGWRLVIPAEHRPRVLHEAHDEPSAGHLGQEKTYDRVARQYYWPGIWHDVQNYVSSCDVCQRYKLPQTGPQGLLGRRIVERPWAVVAVDTMEFPRSKSGCKYLLVFQDLFTRYVELKPLRQANGKAVANALEELILFRWEVPDYLLTDNGREFINKTLKQVLDEYGVKHVTTPPYHPQANPVERSNRTLKAVISAFVRLDHREWDKHLHEFRQAINTSIQSTTRVSPAYLNFGRHPQQPKSLRREVEVRGPKIRLDPSIWADRVKRLDALRDLVAKHIDRAHAKQKRLYDQGRKGHCAGDNGVAVEEAEDNEELTESSFNVSDSTVDLDELSALAEKEYAVARYRPQTRSRDSADAAMAEEPCWAVVPLRTPREQAPLPQHDQPPRRQLLPPPRATQQSDQQAVQPEKTVRQTAPGRTTSARPINGNVERELREATNALTQAKAWAEAADAAAWRKQREAEKAMKDAKEAAATARRAALIAAEATEQARLAAAEADEAEKAVTEAVNRRRYAERQALTGQRVVLGCLFQDVKLIRTDDSIDPQARTCFNCWQDDHERINCRKKQTRDFCYNCGRVGVQMPDCPRCGEGYVRWLARHPEKRASATKPSQAPKPEIRRPGPKVHVPPKAFLDRYPDEPERNHYDRIRNALKGVEMLTQVKILKEYFPNGAPTSKAKRFDPTTQNTSPRTRTPAPDRRQPVHRRDARRHLAARMRREDARRRSTRFVSRSRIAFQDE
ncbi:unnamed protein product [Trichogramma brassicae]|uniref:RNA-directed DNA polymerase n=1 Tax=Trichogramma brassicae TaxID=86971 RepID=A0A6H5J0U1_9HYME|nr:unnamed protein product [Trichogramma brassicae]